MVIIVIVTTVCGVCAKLNDREYVIHAIVGVHPLCPLNHVLVAFGRHLSSKNHS